MFRFAFVMGYVSQTECPNPWEGREHVFFYYLTYLSGLFYNVSPIPDFKISLIKADKVNLQSSK